MRWLKALWGRIASNTQESFQTDICEIDVQELRYVDKGLGEFWCERTGMCARSGNEGQQGEARDGVRRWDVTSSDGSVIQFVVQEMSSAHVGVLPYAEREAHKNTFGTDYSLIGYRVMSGDTAFFPRRSTMERIVELLLFAIDQPIHTGSVSVWRPNTIEVKFDGKPWRPPLKKTIKAERKL